MNIFSCVRPQHVAVKRKLTKDCAEDQGAIDPDAQTRLCVEGRTGDRAGLVARNGSSLCESELLDIHRKPCKSHETNFKRVRPERRCAYCPSLMSGRSNSKMPSGSLPMRMRSFSTRMLLASRRVPSGVYSW